MKYLVTGATGYIGRALCAQLLAQGQTVLAVSRSGAALADGTPTLALDLSLTGIPPDLLEGVDAVLHLAGIAHQRALDSSYEQLNYKATLQLARDAQAAGVRCFVFLSSVKAMGRPDNERARGESECNLPPEPYGLSKWRAECDLRRDFENSGMAVHIIRPSLVYGNQPKGNLALLSKGIRFGLPRPPREGGRSMLALDDLVRLICLTIASDTSGVNTWIATDGRCYSTREVYDLLRQQAGKGTGVAWWPRWLWRLVAATYDTLRPSAESAWDKLFATELYSNASVCATLGWSPRLTLADVILSTPDHEGAQ